MKTRPFAWSLILSAISVFAAGAAGSPSFVPLLNGKDLSGWHTIGGAAAPAQWKIGKAALDASDPTRLTVAGSGNELVSPEKGANLMTETEFGDCVLELEFMMSRNSNSGVKLMKIYEIQLLDSFGKEKPDSSDCGAVYKESAPKVNASRAPGEWQKLVIDFRAPRFDADGKKVANARFVKVLLNGQLVQEDVEVEHGTNVSRNVKEVAKAPLFLQGDHGPVAFRNIRISPL